MKKLYGELIRCITILFDKLLGQILFHRLILISSDL